MKRKKIASVFLSFALLVTMGNGVAFAEGTINEGNTASKGTFHDMFGHWAKATIEEAAQLKIVGGYPDGTFLPDNLIKREEFYTLMSNVLTQKPDITNTKINFNDVDPIEWYIPTVKTAVAGGMTKGYPDGTFGIGRMMTRQEAAQVASTVLSSSGAENNPGAERAKDKAMIDPWAYNAVNLMFQKGYMKGDSEGNFRPTNAITRAEAVQLLLQIKKKESIIVGKGQGTPEVTEPVITEPAIVLSGCMKTHLPKLANGSDTSEEALKTLPKGVFTRGNGTENTPYEIATQEQLDHVRVHNQTGVYFKLMQNIEITSDFATTAPPVGEVSANWQTGNWMPIGTKEAPFLGNFDGNHHTISGLNIDSDTENDGRNDRVKGDAAGLFGWTSTESEIKNLRLSASEIQNKGGSYTGAVVGYASGTILGCTVESSTTINEGNYVGGIVGYSAGNVASCTNYAKVESTGAYIGGIVGFYHAGVQNLSQCDHRGAVIGSQNVGGIAGGVDAQAISVDNHAMQEATNYGTVEGQSGNTGGVVGMVDGNNVSVTLYDCKNKGSVESTGVSGGIVGYTKGNRAIINQCVNSGEVNGGNAGGIVGGNEGTVELCSNEGEVNGKNLVGGIIAFQQEEKSKVTKCFNEGRIGKDSEANNIGGIAGQSSTRISNSYNTGALYGEHAVGGIAGKNTGRIINVYNSGNLSGRGEKGSLVGRNLGSLKNCFWLNDTATVNIGINQNKSGLTQVYRVTQKELSGKEEIRTNEGYQLLLDVLNGANAEAGELIWQCNGNDKYPNLVELQ